MSDTNNSEDIGNFQGVQVNFAKEYHTARKMMGNKATNLDDLSYHVGLMYLNTPTKWAEPYMALLNEIELRMEMLSRRQ